MRYGFILCVDLQKKLYIFAKLKINRKHLYAVFILSIVKLWCAVYSVCSQINYGVIFGI